MQTLEIIKNKIMTLEEVLPLRHIWQFKSEKVVFTNGVFDLVHQGHIDYLSKAKDLGKHLIIGLNTDASVRRLNKGPERPLNDEYSRALLLAALHFTDAIILFDDDTPLHLIETIVPDVLVKGSDYKVEEIVGHEVVLSNGGQVIPLDFLPGFFYYLYC